MEDSLIQLDKVEHIFLTEVFNKECSVYMAMGMSYEQFWRDDPTMAKAYREADKKKQKILKWNNWEQGMYTYEALCKVSPVLHAFAKNGTKPLPFSKEPYGIKKIEEENIEKEQEIKEEKIVENERLKAQIFFNNWYRSTKAHFENMKEGE